MLYMSVQENRFCSGCGSPFTGDARCQVCGCDNIDREALPAGHLLNDRYRIEKLMTMTGESAVYSGYDNKAQGKVTISEYFPDTLSVRDFNGQILPRKGCGAQYKALMSDYIDLCFDLKKLSVQEAVVPLEDVVYANNTVYAVYRHLSVVTLEEYLHRRGGKLEWARVRDLLMPLLNIVSNINTDGIIHRGISPYTVYLDKKGKLYLGGFAIAAARTDRSEISAQLYSGYAAPEQYTLSGWQGIWTDVYAVAAVIYRTLTGVHPPAADNRSVGKLWEPDVLDGSVPEQVSQTLMSAMEIKVNRRIQSMEVLSFKLLENENQERTTVYATVRPQDVPAHLKNEERDTMSARRRRRGGKPYMLLALIATTLALLGIIWFVMSNFYPELIGREKEPPSNPSQSSSPLFSDNEEDESGSAESMEEQEVPNFVGQPIDAILGNAEMQARYEFNLKEEYSDEYEEGMVIKQSPEPGLKANTRITVLLTVSKGVEPVDMPDIIGRNVEEALKILDELKIKYDIIEVFDQREKDGVILRMNKAPGSPVIPEKDTVTIFVKAGDLSSSEPESSSSKAESDSSSSKSSSSGSAGSSSSWPGTARPPS